MSDNDEESSSFPCSICKTSFENPKDLGTHILKMHCLQSGDMMTSTPPESLKSDDDDSEDDSMTLFDEDEESDDVDKSNNEWAESLNNHRFNNVVKDLPRVPTSEEKRTQFMIHRMDDFSIRYICLICSKAYTSRYNIRMHMNLHLGRNVHACKFCGRYFAHKHVYESHLRTHTGEKPFPCNRCGRPFSDRSNCSAHQKKCRSFKSASLRLILSANNNNNVVSGGSEEAPLQISLPTEPLPLSEISDQMKEIKTEKMEEDDISFPGPQIVSVETCADDDFSIDDLEEIQIEPDIIDYAEEGANNNNSSNQQVDKKAGDKKPLPSKEPPPVSSKARLVSPTTIYTCSFCSAKFKEQEYLFKHLSEHVNIPKAVEKEDFERGYLIFYFTSRLKALCLFCGKIFATEEQVKIHINIHYDENIYNCRFCDKVFSDFGNFELHIKSHSEEFKYSCRYCENAFMSRMVLVQHIKTCSANEDLYKAGGSPKTDLERSLPSLTPLSEGGESETPATKSICSDDFHSSEDDFNDDYIPDNNSNNVINKSAIHPPPTEEERVVGFCLRQLKNGRTRFICVRCGKHYTTNYNMRQHLNIHTGKGLHTCRFCKRSFTHKHVWETHERIHTGERPFKCEFCAKDFADRSNYNSHRKLCAMTRQKPGELSSSSTDLV